jgi:hypothetical protein
MALDNPTRKRALERRDAKCAEVAAGAWSRCMFFLERKKRFCSIPRAPGSAWCGHHTPEHQAARPRAPCPVDPSHTAFVDELHAHAARCASAAQAAAARAQPFFSARANAGGCGGAEAARVAALRATAAPTATAAGGGRSRGSGALERLFAGAAPGLDVPALCHALLAWAAAAPTLPLRALCAAPRGVAHLRASLATTLGARGEVPLPGELPTGSEEEAALAALRLAGRTLFRHELQQVSIVSNALADVGCGGGGGGAFGMELVANARGGGASTCFVEFGAGSGKLSFTVDRLASPVRLILLDRGAMRSKGDREVRRAAAAAEGAAEAAAAAGDAAAGGDGAGEEAEEEREGEKEEEEEEEEETEEASGSAGPRAAVGSTLARARIDIADVNLGALLDAQAAGEGVPPERVVALGKHVCGAATDFTLRAVALACAPCGARRVAALAGDSGGEGAVVETGAPLPPPPHHRLAALSVALCCHHACDWAAYVGKAFWRDALGQSAEAFEAARFLSSWALLEEFRGGGEGSGAGAGAAAPPPLAAPPPSPPPRGGPAAAGTQWAAALTTPQRAAIGRAAKRAIDEGRLRFLAAAFEGAPGVSPRLSFYVPLRVSLENVLLSA